MGHNWMSSLRERAPIVLAVALVLAVSAPVRADQASTSASTPVVDQVLGVATSSTGVVLPTWTPGPDDLTIVAVATQASRNIRVGVSGNGLKFDLVTSVRNSQNIETLAVFRAQGAATSGAVSVNLPKNSGAASVLALTVAGAAVGNNGADALESVETDPGPTKRDGDNANMRTTVAATQGGLLLGLGTNRLRTFVLPSGAQSAITNVASGSGGGRISASAWYSNAPDTAVTTVGANNDLVGDSGGDDWAITGVEIQGAPPATSTPSSAPSTSDTSTTTSSSVPASTTTSSTVPASTTTSSTVPASTTTTSTVPASTCPDVATGACLPYDGSSPWNTPISTSPTVDPNSARYINAIADNGLPLTSDPDQYTIPVYQISATTPLATVNGNGYFSTYDNGDQSRVGHGSPWTFQVPVPTAAQGGVGSDSQIVLLDPASGTEWGFWQFAPDPTSPGNYIASNGYRYHSTSGYDGRFADGLAGRGDGTPYLAGLVRPWEISQGQIDHALAFGYNSPSSTFVYPASKSDGGAFGGLLGVDLPEGSHLQLNPALTDADFTQWGLNPAAKIIARALQRYGMYVVDHSGSSKIYLEARSTAQWDPSINRSILSAIPWTHFRVITN